MAERYTVVRAIRGLQTRDPFSGGLMARDFGSLGSSIPETQVEVTDLRPKDLRELGRDPEVAAIAPVMPLKLVKPNDVPVQNAATSAWGISAVGADKSTFTGEGVVVAVLDTGIDASHPAFQGVTLVQQDFSGSGNGDKNGHGTHCAGTIFGRDVNGTRIGVARGVKKALIGKVLSDDGGGGSDALFQAIEWAMNQGARVISMSLGFDFPGFVQQSVDSGWPADLATSRALEAYRANLRAFDALMALIRARVAFDGGVVIAAAAGNESKRDVNPDYEIAVSLPAAAEGVVSVAAVGQDGQGYSVASFSNSQPEVSAPGVNILSAKAGGGLRALNGTSMATPHVAGIAALWWQAMQAQTPMVRSVNVVAKLLATARADKFTPKFDVSDRGVGVVAAP